MFFYFEQLSLAVKGEEVHSHFSSIFDVRYRLHWVGVHDAIRTHSNVKCCLYLPLIIAIHGDTIVLITVQIYTSLFHPHMMDLSFTHT